MNRYEIKKIYRDRLIVGIPKAEFSNTIYSIHTGPFYKRIYCTDMGNPYVTYIGVGYVSALDNSAPDISAPGLFGGRTFFLDSLFCSYVVSVCSSLRSW